MSVRYVSRMLRPASGSRLPSSIGNRAGSVAARRRLQLPARCRRPEIREHDQAHERPEELAQRVRVAHEQARVQHREHGAHDAFGRQLGRLAATEALVAATVHRLGELG